MANITAIPPELWQDIITLACTGSEPTGKSLALSCRFLHVQSFNPRFHSLALSSLAQLESFLDFARSFAPNWTPPVRHLWLAFLDESGPPPTTWTTRYPDMPYWPGQPDNRSFAAGDARYATAISELLRLVASTLRSLCVLQNSWQPLPPIQVPHLPLLGELTIMGSTTVLLHPTSFAREDEDEEEALSMSFPSLRRFHSVSFTPYTRTAILASSSGLANLPITHLCISGVSEADKNTRFAHALAHALGVPEPVPVARRTSRGPENEAGTEQVPVQREAEAPLAGVRCLVVQGCHWDPCSDGTLGDWEAVTDLLGDVGRTTKGVGGACALMLDQEWRSNLDWRARLWADWMSRIKGGRGCWAA